MRKTNTIALSPSCFWGGFFAIGVTIPSEVTHPLRKNRAKSLKKKKSPGFSELSSDFFLSEVSETKKKNKAKVSRTQHHWHRECYESLKKKTNIYRVKNCTRFPKRGRGRAKDMGQGSGG